MSKKSKRLAYDFSFIRKKAYVLFLLPRGYVEGHKEKRSTKCLS